MQRPDRSHYLHCPICLSMLHPRTDRTTGQVCVPREALCIRLAQLYGSWRAGRLWNWSQGAQNTGIRPFSGLTMIYKTALRLLWKEVPRETCCRLSRAQTGLVCTGNLRACRSGRSVVRRVLRLLAVARYTRCLPKAGRKGTTPAWGQASIWLSHPTLLLGSEKPCLSLLTLLVLYAEGSCMSAPPLENA